MSEELKLCPFCGGKVDFVFINHYTLASRRYDFICKDCGAQISMFAKVKYKSAEMCDKEAIEAWNRRVNNE